jgi:hypothetical protein
MTTTDTCWADPLSRKERCELAVRLSRSCKRSFTAARFVAARDPQAADIEMMHALTLISAEVSDLYQDVTERAEVPPEVLERAACRAAERRAVR